MNSDNNIHLQLLQSTIGGAGALVDPAVIKTSLEKYLKEALHGISITSINPRITTAALNSVSALVRFTLNGSDYDTFCKVHIESNRDESKQSGAAGVNEYHNANLIAEHGWPVNKPILQDRIDPNFPLIIYPLITDPTLFDLIERGFSTGEQQLTEADFEGLSDFNKAVGSACVRSTRMVPSHEAVSERTAPMQSLFYERLTSGGRISQWYTEDRIFDLPGADGKSIPTPWSSLLEYNWIINGSVYNINLRQILERSRMVLSYEGQEQAAVCISHGDDHAGNLFLRRPMGRTDGMTQVTCMDPAFAGWNPALLSHVKPFIHNGILPAAGMYYEPGIPECTYDISGTTANVTIDYQGTPNFKHLVRLSNQITDTRIIPMARHLKSIGCDLEFCVEQFRYALTTCCYLVIDVAKLLHERSTKRASGERCTAGTGEGLLPLIFLCVELNQLPQLTYLRDELKKVLS